MIVSETARLFIEKCFDNGDIRGIQARFGEIYLINNEKCKFDQIVLKEIIDSEKVKVIYQTEKIVNLLGIKGMG
ncbi:hypothetical protein NV379_01820 [Paenibacillus sp. N1-5-1-14]|uniref:hypothetical protein n=1 Tax=Paenibacillus radicibacter TaxID=2972488 RepID=UPI002158F806|nr:hypothetical protein [Paenibacillus radicibacter]MCR8641382.1 hypothetical protein [Paenibacillus radicibacter]